jgi:hypothetical protein
MVKFTVTTNGKEFQDAQARWAKKAEKAFLDAIDRTAVAIKEAEVNLMKLKFDRPTRFTLNSLYVKRTQNKVPIAYVETKQGFNSVPAGRFLSPQVEGGQRRMKSHERQLGGYTIPGKSITLNQYGNLPGSTYVKILSQLGISRDASPTPNAQRPRDRARLSSAGTTSSSGARARTSSPSSSSPAAHPINPSFRSSTKRKRYGTSGSVQSSTKL